MMHHKLPITTYHFLIFALIFYCLSTFFFSSNFLSFHSNLLPHFSRSHSNLLYSALYFLTFYFSVERMRGVILQATSSWQTSESPSLV